MTIRNVLYSMAVAGALVSAPCGAETAGPDRSAEIKRTLESRFPSTPIEKVAPMRQLPGLYEVITPSEVAYVDATGNYLFAGRIMDTRTQENLTAQRWSELHAIDFAALPFERAIKTVRGDGSRRIAVFADPDCPYCQKLEQELRQVDNVTVYTFLFPLAIHPDARNKSMKIWCAQEREVAWSRWMLDGVTVQAEACASDVIDQNLKLGSELQVSATPTLFFSDGQRIDGTLAHAELEKKLTNVTAARR